MKGRDEKERIYAGVGYREVREAEVLLGRGNTVVEVSRKLGITEQTYYQWRREYGGIRVEHI